MGTYALPDPETPAVEDDQTEKAAPAAMEKTTNLLRQLRQLEGAKGDDVQVDAILLGTDAETGEEVFWNPDQASGTPNPHVLILGESGTGKTYSISCLVAELARAGIVSIVFDYGQGFSPKTLSREFVKAVDPVELHAGREYKTNRERIVPHFL
jgi:hypothetical protein